MERTPELEKKIRDDVYNFFSDQCSIPVTDLNENTNIIEDIDGDSLMFLQLLEMWKREYDINLEFRVIGKYITKNPTETIGKSIELAMMVICESDKILELANI